MADEIDLANDTVERTLADAVRARKPAGPEANGRCHWCGELVGDALRWCDATCRDSWQSLTRRKA